MENPKKIKSPRIKSAKTGDLYFIYLKFDKNSEKEMRKFLSAEADSKYEVMLDIFGKKEHITLQELIRRLTFEKFLRSGCVNKFSMRINKRGIILSSNCCLVINELF